MPCPRATRGRHRRRINLLLAHPATRAARHSRVLRRHLDAHGWVTPHFAWSEMDDTGGAAIPSQLRPNAIRHAWRLELFARRLGKKAGVKRVSIRIDGPYRTPTHNRAVGGASQSRHMSADASDHFLAQVQRWQQQGRGLTRQQVLDIAYRTFVTVGNETSGTLHLDSRPGRIGSVRFVKW